MTTPDRRGDGRIPKASVHQQALNMLRTPQGLPSVTVPIVKVVS